VIAQVLTTISILGVGVGEACGSSPPRRPCAARGRPRTDHQVRVSERGLHGADLVRTWIAPLTLGIVRSAGEVGLFRAAQMPQNGLAAVSSPLRMILLMRGRRATGSTAARKW